LSKNYEAGDIEVLTGLDPVRKRPGIYTDISHPNFTRCKFVGIYQRLRLN